MLKTHPHLHIRQLEGVLGFSRQAYYQYWQRQADQPNHEADVVELVKAIRGEHPRMGGRKLYKQLSEELSKREIKMGRDALFELLAANGLLIRRRRYIIKTTFSQHRFRKYPNLIKELDVDRPNQLWVADITYWFTHYGCLYVSLITDAYSKRIMGFGVAETLRAVHCKGALEMALEQIDRRIAATLIHHSDRGIQYCSSEYVAVLESYQIQISMTENGDPRENAIAERINGILKQEYLSQQPVTTLVQAQVVLQQAVHLYNYQRPHLSLDMLVPDEAHKREGKLKRRWQNYYHKKVLAQVLDKEKSD
jgi:transposase InsO family protein